MKIKLREVNGSYYMLINQTFRELMGIETEVEVSLDKNKIIVKKVNEEIKNK